MTSTNYRSLDRRLRDLESKHLRTVFHVVGNGEPPEIGPGEELVIVDTGIRRGQLESGNEDHID